MCGLGGHFLFGCYFESEVLRFAFLLLIPSSGSGNKVIIIVMSIVTPTPCSGGNIQLYANNVHPCPFVELMT